MTDNLFVTIRIRFWVRPVVRCLALLGYAIAFVSPRAGIRYTFAVVRWIKRVGLVVE
jgi:hypothetical protein